MTPRPVKTHLPGIRQRKGRAPYLFLFGREGELLTWLLPTREQMEQIGKEKGYRPPPLVAITDSAACARRLANAGHTVSCIKEYDREEPEAAHRLLTAEIEGMARRIPIGSFVLTSEFPYLFPDPEPLLRKARKRRSLVPFRGRKVSSTVLTTDVCSKTYNVGKLAMRANRRKSQQAVLELGHYGLEALYDYHLRLVHLEPRRISPLGWRVPPPPRLGSEDREPSLLVCVQSPLPRRDVVYDLLPLMEPLGLKRMVVWGDCGHWLPESPEVEAEASLLGFLDRAAHHRGLIVADGGAPLLPLLSCDARVALVRSVAQDRDSLMRWAYFAGSKRWPTFCWLRNLTDALRQAPSIDAFWEPFANRKSPIEEQPGGDFHEGVTDFFRELCS